MQRPIPPIPALEVKGALTFRLDPASRAAILSAAGGEPSCARLCAALLGRRGGEGLEVAIGGLVLRHTPSRRRPLLFLPAHPVLPAALTPRALLALLPPASRSPDEVLATVGLAGRAAIPFRHLPPPARRRLLLAALLLRHPLPPLLVAEEPEEGFEPSMCSLLAGLLEPGAAFGETAFLLIARRAESVFALAAEAGVLGGGGLSPFAPPQRLYDEPPDLLTARAMGPVNLLPVRLVALEGEEAEVEEAGGRRFWCKAPSSGVALGERTCLMIRPERIAMAALAAEELEGGAIAAVITRVLERGKDVVFHLRLDAGPLWEVRRPAAMRGGFQAGQRVALAWPETAARLYPFGLPSGSLPSGLAEGEGEGAR